MYFISTRGKKEKIKGSQAIINGICSDGGLYVPESFPDVSDKLDNLVNLSYKDLCFEILKLYLDDFTEEELKNCINKAYDDKFDCKEIAPTVKVKDKYFLELYHGPTCALKDMALTLMPLLLETSLKKNNIKEDILILTATSGDTGKAALEGFKNLNQVKIIVFFPEDGVSSIQKLQMQSQEGNNTYVVSINGNFDDAQSAVKTIFNDEEFKEILKNNNYILSSANSINIGRLLPQIVYYFYSYFDLVKNKHIKLKDKINFTVPTGNFGNILAAYYAKLMGLPVNKLICTSNDNNVLYDFFNSGIYNKNRELILTSSPSMDILISSNLERLLFEISSRDSEKVNNLIKDLNNKGLYKLDANMKKNLNSFRSEYANELEVKRNINKVFKEYNYLIDTHTCVAYTSYMKYLKKHKDCTPTVIVSTASPYKFSKDVLYSLGEEVNNFDKFEIIEKLSTMLKPNRLQHSINVANCAVKLSEIYSYDKDKAYLAGLVHDCAKYFTKDQVDFYVKKYNIKLDPLETNNIALSHSVIGSFVIQDVFNIQDMDIINAVRYHTTGRENMSTLEKIIFMADMIEEDRNFPGVDELRKLSFNGQLDKALITSLNNTIKFVIENNQLIHPRSVSARNYLMQENI